MPACLPDCSFDLLKAALDVATSELLDLHLQRIRPARDRARLPTPATATPVRIDYDAKDTSGDEVNKLKALGVDLKVAPSRPAPGVRRLPPEIRGHRQELVILGSANWATSSIPNRLPGRSARAGNRQWLLRIDDQGPVGWFRTSFEADFDIEEAPSFGLDFEVEAREPAVATPSFAPLLDIASAFPTLIGTQSPLVSPDNYFAHVKKLIGGAAKRLYLSSNTSSAARTRLRWRSCWPR